MHFASRLLPGKEKLKPAAALHAALCSKLTKHHAKALLVMAASVQREGCVEESVASAPNWKAKSEPFSGLPLFCKFNQPSERMCLSSHALVLVPETCPQVVSALRAAEITELACAEIPEEVGVCLGFPFGILIPVNSYIGHGHLAQSLESPKIPTPRNSQGLTLNPKPS